MDRQREGTALDIGSEFFRSGPNRFCTKISGSVVGSSFQRLGLDIQSSQFAASRCRGNFRTPGFLSCLFHDRDNARQSPS